MENKEIDNNEPEITEQEMTKMIEESQQVLNLNLVFRNKLDQYVFERLPISASDKMRILNEILKENADNLKK
jgi:hypothetical protein